MKGILYTFFDNKDLRLTCQEDKLYEITVRQATCVIKVLIIN